MTVAALKYEYPRVLSIAGSDSGGGAGIQADLKTFSALGCYGMTAITALTAQNTRGVRSIHGVPPQMLRDQIDAVFVAGSLRLWRGWPLDWDARALMREVAEVARRDVARAPIQRVHATADAHRARSA